LRDPAPAGQFKYEREIAQHRLHPQPKQNGTHWQEAIIKLTHISVALALIVSFVLLILGFAKKILVSTFQSF